jgi:predicted deacetylase
MSANNDLLVSIHDVTPAHERSVYALWSICQSVGLMPALLVVPEWHGEWALERHSRFMAWMRARARDGAEIILHGERHDEVGNKRGWRDAVRASGRTAAEGEFLTLDYDAARARIDRGIARLTRLDLAPTGFIPPAWLAREATHQAARDAGLRFSEDATSVRMHTAQRRLAAPALRWSARSAVRAVGSRVVANWRWHAWSHAPLLRLALHPQDLSHPIAALSMVRDVARWAGARRAIRYDAL